MMPDFGAPAAPIGCKGKIDLLFVISRDAWMTARQEQLAVAFPQFIETRSRRSLMTSTTTSWSSPAMMGWGNETCTGALPDPHVQRSASPAAAGTTPQNWRQGQTVLPTCPEYPCNDLDLVTQCDRTWGAGEVFPAGVDRNAEQAVSDRWRPSLPCQGADEPARDLRVHRHGRGQWLRRCSARRSRPRCRSPSTTRAAATRAFFRKDALLMVTFIATHPD
jgi:hypothetical protein